MSTSAVIASRDSHDERQRVEDRHALRGLARCSVDAHSPAMTSTSAIAAAAVSAGDQRLDCAARLRRDLGERHQRERAQPGARQHGEQDDGSAGFTCADRASYQATAALRARALTGLSPREHGACTRNAAAPARSRSRLADGAVRDSDGTAGTARGGRY